TKADWKRKTLRLTLEAHCKAIHDYPPVEYSIDFPLPHLRPPQQREADVSVHVELLAVIHELQFDFVGLAVLGIEDLAAVPHVAVLLHAPHDGHAGHRLVVALAFAVLADRIGALLGEQHLLDHALQRAVRRSGDFDDGFGFAGFVVHLRPGADRRVVGRERLQARQQQGGCEQYGTECGAHDWSPVWASAACDVLIRASRVEAGLQSPSMGFALRANLRLSKFVPDEFVRIAAAPYPE